VQKDGGSRLSERDASVSSDVRANPGRATLKTTAAGEGMKSIGEDPIRIPAEAYRKTVYRIFTVCGVGKGRNEGLVIVSIS